MESLESSKDDIRKKSRESLYDDESDLINRYEVEDKISYQNNFLIKKNKKKRLPLLFYIYIISVLLFIAFFFYFIVQYINKDKNYKYARDKISKPSLSEFKYSNLSFDNGLEVLLIQVTENDTAGGTIIFDAGNLDNQYQYKNLDIAINSIQNITFKEDKASTYFDDYLGINTSNVDNYYSYFSFSILNDGFFKYLEKLSELTYYDNERFDFLQTLINLEINKTNDTEFLGSELKEKKILESIIYGCEKNKNIIIDKNKIKEIIDSILQPNKIKIVLASHFKPSMMKKKFLHYFKRIIKAKKNEKQKLKESVNTYYNESNFLKKKIILFKSSTHNYFKINYFIDKDKNEDYYKFIEKLGYFNYLKYILDETNEGSLYYVLANSSNFTINNISCDFEVILKSKIRFSIKVNLVPSSNSYLEEIIFITYQYINKLINYLGKEEKYHNERLAEIILINQQNFIFKEDTNDIMTFSKILGSKLLDKRNAKNLFKDYWIESYNSKIANQLFSQLTSDNSVTIICLNEEAIDKAINDKKSNIYFKNFTYLLTTINKAEDFYLMIDLEIGNDFKNISKVDDINISFHKNNYISIYTKPIKIEESDKKNFNFNAKKLNQTYENIFREYRYLKDTRFRIPKVHIALNLYHPFNRPVGIEKKSCYYFEYILFLVYIRREINEKLSDAIRAGNKIIVGYNQNYIYVNIFAFSDLAYNITCSVKEIILDTKNKLMDIHNEDDKFDSYVQLTFDDYIKIRGTTNDQTKDKFFLYYSLNPNIFNIYNLNKKYRTKKIYYSDCKNISGDLFVYLTHFIIDCQIYGFYEKEQAEDIAALFNKDIVLETEEQIFNDILNDTGIINYNITLKGFKNWMRLIVANKISKNESELDVYKPRGIYRYMKWSDNYDIIKRVETSIFRKVVNILRGKSGDNRYYFNFIYHGSTYLLIFINTNKTNETLYNTIKEEIIRIYKEKAEHYDEKIDVVGSRFYYVIKNIINQQFIRPRDMENNAFSLLNSYLYKPDNLEDLNKKRKQLYDMGYEDMLNHFIKIYNIDYVDFP